MNNQQFKRQALYQASMNMFLCMCNQGLITKEQLIIINQKMLEKYNPLICVLLDCNA